MKICIGIETLELRESAPAKINLSLGVVGKQPDNYHLMEMINHSIPLCDELILTPSNSFKFTCNLDHLINGENLVLRVIQLMSQLTKQQPNFHVHLQKNIPHKAGLGGGSSDAAAMFRLLKRYWNLNIDENQMRKLALKVGADVPYCLENKTAYVTGLGEKIVKIKEFEPKHCLLILPKIPVETRQAFMKLDSSESIDLPDSIGVVETIEKEDYHNLKNVATNSFTKVVSEEFPVIQEIINTLYDNRAFYATMSGTGSSIIGYFDSEEDREKAEENLTDFETIKVEGI